MKRLMLWLALLLFSAACIAMVANVIISASRDHARRRGTAAVRGDRAAELLAGEGENRDRWAIVGLVGPKDEHSYQSMAQGASLAQTEINDEGGILNHKFELDIRDDEGSVSRARSVAQSFADNLDTIAVIGHPDSEIALTTAIIYEYSGLLYLSPTATVPTLTQNGHTRLIRNIPNDVHIGNALANFAVDRGYNNILVYYIGNAYGREFANAFESKAVPLGVNIIDRRAYDALTTDRQFRDTLQGWKRHFEFDAILLAGSLPQAGQFIQAAREVEVDVPILTGTELDTKELGEQIGPAARDVYVASVFDPEEVLNSTDETSRLGKEFIEKYKKRYGTMPDFYAAKGYDAVKLLTASMKTIASFDPTELAEHIRSSRSWVGVTGLHSFNENGDVEGKKVTVKPYPVPATAALTSAQD